MAISLENFANKSLPVLSSGVENTLFNDLLNLHQKNPENQNNKEKIQSKNDLIYGLTKPRHASDLMLQKLSGKYGMLSIDKITGQYTYKLHKYVGHALALENFNVKKQKISENFTIYIKDFKGNYDCEEIVIDVDSQELLSLIERNNANNNIVQPESNSEILNNKDFSNSAELTEMDNHNANTYPSLRLESKIGYFSIKANAGLAEILCESRTLAKQNSDLTYSYGKSETSVGKIELTNIKGDRINGYCVEYKQSLMVNLGEQPVFENFIIQVKDKRGNIGETSIGSVQESEEPQSELKNLILMPINTNKAQNSFKYCFKPADFGTSFRNGNILYLWNGLGFEDEDENEILKNSADFLELNFANITLSSSDFENWVITMTKQGSENIQTESIEIMDADGDAKYFSVSTAWDSANLQKSKPTKKERIIKNNNSALEKLLVAVNRLETKFDDEHLSTENSTESELEVVSNLENLNSPIKTELSTEISTEKKVLHNIDEIVKEIENVEPSEFMLSQTAGEVFEQDISLVAKSLHYDVEMHQSDLDKVDAMVSEIINNSGHKNKFSLPNFAISGSSLDVNFKKNAESMADLLNTARSAVEQLASAVSLLEKTKGLEGVEVKNVENKHIETEARSTIIDDFEILNGSQYDFDGADELNGDYHSEHFTLLHTEIHENVIHEAEIVTTIQEQDCTLQHIENNDIFIEVDLNAEEIYCEEDFYPSELNEESPLAKNIGVLIGDVQFYAVKNMIESNVIENAELIVLGDYKNSDVDTVLDALGIYQNDGSLSFGDGWRKLEDQAHLVKGFITYFDGFNKVLLNNSLTPISKSLLYKQSNEIKPLYEYEFLKNLN